MDLKDLQKELENVSTFARQQTEASAPQPAKSAAPAPASAQAPTQTPADVAPSAPSAGAPTETIPQKTAYQSYMEYEYVGQPDQNGTGSLRAMEMKFTAGEGNAPGAAKAGDTRNNIEKIIAGERTSTSRQYPINFKPGETVVLTIDKKPAALVKVKAVYKILGTVGDKAVLMDTSTGLQVQKPIVEMAKMEMI